MLEPDIASRYVAHPGRGVDDQRIGPLDIHIYFLGEM